MKEKQIRNHYTFTHIRRVFSICTGDMWHISHTAQKIRCPNFGN